MTAPDKPKPINPETYSGFDKCQRCGYPWSYHYDKNAGCPRVVEGIVNGWSAYQTFVGEKPDGIKGCEI